MLYFRHWNDGSGRQCCLDGCNDFERFGHPTWAILAAGHHALLRPDHKDAVIRETGEVSLRRWMKPHPDVHRRREEDPLVGREQQRAREVVGDALCHLGHEIGGGRCHNQEVGRAREFDMAHFGLVGQRKQVVVDPLSRETRDRQGGYECLGGLRHHGPNHPATFTKAPHQIEDLVGCYAAADDQEDAPVRQGLFDRHDLSMCSDDRGLRVGNPARLPLIFSYRSCRGATEQFSTLAYQAPGIEATSEIAPAFKKSLREKGRSVIKARNVFVACPYGRFLPRLGPPFRAVFFCLEHDGRVTTKQRPAFTIMLASWQAVG